MQTIQEDFSGVIRDYAFQDCSSLEEVVIPENVASIGQCAFMGCTSLNSITVNAVAPIVLGTDEVYGCSVFDATNNCPIYVPAESVDAYRDQWAVYATRIFAIGEQGYDGIISFEDADVKNICIQNWDLNGDGELSYSEASQATGYIPEAFSEIDHPYTFNEFRYFTGFDFIDGFYYCGNLREISIPASITSINQYSAFGYCNGLESIVSYNKYYSVYNGCLLIDNRTNTVVLHFNGDGHESVEIPSGVTQIAEWAFGHQHGTKKVVLPDTVTKIEGNAFTFNDRLEEIVIGSSLSYIGNGAFARCPSLSSITINTITPPEVGDDGLVDINEVSNLTIYVPGESVESYKSSPYWSRYSEIIKPIGGTVISNPDMEGGW